MVEARLPPKSDKPREKLAQIDKFFQDGQLEPDDYIRLRKGLTKETEGCFG